MVILKDTTGGSWVILDNQRNTNNVVNNVLRPDANDAQNTGTDILDFLSNGFKIRMNGSFANDTGENYFYAAWAEAPSFNLYGGQANAR